MNGAHLLETLKQLGYPGVEHLDAASLDWMFEDEAVLPFLDWFCDNVTPSNLLTLKEQEEFHELEASEGVLEGEQLEEALHNISALDDDLSEERLQEEVKLLEEEVAASNEKKNKLIQLRNKLSVHQTYLRDRSSKMDIVEKRAKSAYKNILEQKQADNAQVNACYDDLTSAVSELTTLYQDIAAGTSERRNPEADIFLSQINLNSYYRAEEKFTQELTAFTKKQFFSGIAQMAGSTEGTKYEFLEISNPVNLLVRGEREEVNLEDCKSLARLQAIYPRSEALRINALIEEKATQAACEFAEEKLRTIKENPYPTDMKELSSRLQDAQTLLGNLRRDVNQLAERDIPTAIKDSASLQVTKVLRGDYNLKIARQNYFTSNQEQVINQLVIQRARNEFLTMAYELEAKTHRDTHRLLTAVIMLLHRNHMSFESRMKMMDDPSLSGARHQRGTIDSRDLFSSRLYSLLDPDTCDKQQLFLTFAGLAENADKLHNQVTSQRASMSSSNSSQEDRMAVLESSLKTCESMLYAGSATKSGQPLMNPKPILDTLTQLDGMVKKLEQAAMDVIKDVESKKKSIRIDPLQATERELFLYFHNDPDKLRRAVDNINARLQATLVK